MHPNVAWLRRALCFSLGLLAGTGCAEREGNQTGLVVLGGEEHDFGKRRQGEVLTHVFSLVNKAHTPVKIVELKSSCGCLVADTIKGPIAAGDSVALPIRFTTGAAQETTSGHIVVGYRRVSNLAASDPPDYVSLRVRAEVVPDYRITPREVDFGVIDGLAVQQVTGIIRVLPEAVADLVIQEVTASSAFLSTQILPKDADDPGVHVKVSLNVSGFNQSGPFNGSVVLSTDSKRTPKAIVPVRAKYDAPAQVEPRTIVIGSDERREVERQLRLTTSRPARVHSVRCSGDEPVRVEFSSRLGAREHLLQVFVAPRREKPLDCELQLQLELLTEGGQNIVRTLRVPIHRFVQKGG